MKVIAVVVTHNRADLLQECIYRLCNIDKGVLQKYLLSTIILQSKQL